ncbi:hypothetical protein G6F43_013449 [Rhizopus delemar]|nr:hypothetical protein G6F43_013449 [Rhizopus delemar]
MFQAWFWTRKRMNCFTFTFPATIPESPTYDTFSAPPSPPQSTWMGRQEFSGDRQQHVTRRKMIVDEQPYMPVRRASMPLVSHSLPHISEDAEKPRKETPYSRSPALRVSHKLAERKRRKEMKCLFDELRDSLPVEKNMKTSKWEILSKAVEYISLLKRRDYDMETEINKLRREINIIKRERSSFVSS